MPWVRFDDQFPIHRKVAGLSDKTYRLHTEAIFWCARNLTDGHISAANLRQIRPALRSPASHAAVLVSQQLWHPAGEDCASEKCPAPLGTDGWVIHDYWQYQPSKAQVVRERAAAARRQAKFRNAVNNAVTAPVTDSVTPPVSNAAPTRPYTGTAVTEPVRGSPARRANPSYDRQKINPERGERPYDRPLAGALEAAGISPNGRPARGATVASIADQIRADINRAAEEDG